MKYLAKVIFVAIIVCFFNISGAVNGGNNHEDDHNYPYHVHILIDETLFDVIFGDFFYVRSECEGSLLSTTRVLTAASCIINDEIIPIVEGVTYTILADNIRLNYEEAISKTAARAYITTEYNCATEGNQFGVLEVNDPFTGEFVGPLTLDLSYDYSKLYEDQIRNVDVEFNMYINSDDRELRSFKFNYLIKCDKYAAVGQNIPPGTICGYIEDGQELQGQNKRGSAVYVGSSSGLPIDIKGIGVLTGFEYTAPGGIVIGFYGFKSSC